MKRISTHVLDTARGKPAPRIPVRLEQREPSGGWLVVATAETDIDGRCQQLLPDDKQFGPGIYRLTFETLSYHADHGSEALYPAVQITFQARDGESHFHLPLLLSPYGYTTYRGS
jgi:5-hydroxyisourate hydrolase